MVILACGVCGWHGSMDSLPEDEACPVCGLWAWLEDVRVLHARAGAERRITSRFKRVPRVRRVNPRFKRA